MVKFKIFIIAIFILLTSLYIVRNVKRSNSLEEKFSFLPSEEITGITVIHSAETRIELDSKSVIFDRVCNAVSSFPKLLKGIAPAFRRGTVKESVHFTVCTLDGFFIELIIAYSPSAKIVALQLYDADGFSIVKYYYIDAVAVSAFFKEFECLDSATNLGRL